MKVLVGSTNPVKISAVKEAFSKFFEKVEVTGLKVDSGVHDQPVNEETFTGARNRALALRKIKEKADYFVGIEGGILNLDSNWFAFGCMCIIDSEGRTGYGSSPHFMLSKSIYKQLLQGAELGDVMDELTGEQNTKQKEGSIGYFTKGVMNRKDFYTAGLIVALVPFINKKLYF